MTYTVWVKARAEKALRRRIHPDRAHQIREAIDGLAQDPRPLNSRQLQGRPGRRLRVGHYRILYAVDDENEAVMILDVWHRQRGYR